MCISNKEHNNHTCSLNHNDEHNHKHHQSSFHGAVCSSSCDHEKHEQTGFSTTLYTKFVTTYFIEQVDYSIKYYLDLQDTLF